MFKKLYNKFMNWVLRTFYTVEMTPKGEYFLRYLTKIVNEEFTEKDYNEHYEATLQELMEIHNITRLEAATVYYRYFKALKAYADSFKEEEEYE